jgi:hypothetical protein
VLGDDFLGWYVLISYLDHSIPSISHEIRLSGAFLGRIGDKMGAKSRAWLFMGTMLQALFTMAAAVVIWQSGESDFAADRGTPSWTNALSFVCIGFMSASLGLQGIMGKRVNTQFATTSTYPFSLQYL